MQKGEAGYGGYRRMSYELIKHIKAVSGGSILLLAEKASGFPKDVVAIENIKFSLPSVLKVRQLIRDCDIIHALDVWPTAVIAWLANIGLSKKLVISTVGTASVKPLYEFPKSHLVKRAYLAANQVTAISRFVADEIKQVIPNLKIKVVNLGVDLKKFNLAHQCDPRYLSQVKNWQPYILSVGDVRQRKGYHVSVAAFAEARSKIPELNYVVVGYKDNNDYTRSIIDEVNSRGLQKAVHFLEDISDGFLQELYHHAKLFMLLPVNIGHDFEGFGLVFLEAAANSLPAITTSGNGSADAVLNGQTGLVVPQKDSASAATAVIKLLSDSGFRQQMSKNAREFAGKMKWEGVAEKYLEIYTAQLNKNLTVYNHPAVVEKYQKESLYGPEEIIFNDFFIPRGKTLDIGCGAGRTTINLHKKGFAVTGIDFAENMIKQAKQNYPELDLELMDVTKLQFPSNTFDNILFSFNGLDYLYPKSNRLAALEEIYRALKPKGVFAFSSHNSKFIPNSPGRIKNWLLNIHHLILGSNYYIDRQKHGDLFTFRANPSSQVAYLDKVGFKVIKILSRYTVKNWLVQFRDPWPYYVCRK